MQVPASPENDVMHCAIGSIGILNNIGILRTFIGQY